MKRSSPLAFRFRAAPRRVRLGLFLLIAFASVSTGKWLAIAASTATQPPGRDDISVFEARLGELRKLLPTGSPVGYISDPIPSGLSRAESRLHFRRYLLTQYALVPALVVHGSRPDLVLGVFETPAHADTAMRLGLELVSHPSTDLFLFRNPR